MVLYTRRWHSWDFGGEDMMTDRELLEAAARAAGIVLLDRPDLHAYGDGLMAEHGIWSPLTDDGDALRLAVKLRISVYHAPSGFSLAVSADGSVSFKEDNIGEQNTRRAIVRAAAAMAPKG